MIWVPTKSLDDSVNKYDFEINCTLLVPHLEAKQTAYDQHWNPFVAHCICIIGFYLLRITGDEARGFMLPVLESPEHSLPKRCTVSHEAMGRYLPEALLGKPSHEVGECKSPQLIDKDDAVTRLAIRPLIVFIELRILKWFGATLMSVLANIEQTKHQSARLTSQVKQSQHHFPPMASIAWSPGRILFLHRLHLGIRSRT
jgi:hypothetical protein